MGKLSQHIDRSVQTALGLVGQTLMLPVRSTASPGLSVATWNRELRNAPLPPVRGTVAVLALRNYTWIEWAVYTAFWMRKLGYASVLVYSGREVEQLYGRTGGLSLARRLFLRGFWKEVMRIPDLITCDLDTLPEPNEQEKQAYDEFADNYAHTMTAYDLRVEEREQGPLRPEYLPRLRENLKILTHCGAQTETAFRNLQAKHGVERLIAYSGLIGVTCVMGEAARRVGWKVAFAEGWAVKSGHMIVSVDAPALVYNIQGWLESLGQWDEQKAREIDAFLAFQETPDSTNAEWLQGYHQFQRSQAGDELPKAVTTFLSDDDRPVFLLAPNVVGDSATLRSGTIFASQREWISEVCRFFAKHPELKLIVRAHPDEWFLKAKVRVPMGEVARQAAAGCPNILVIDGSEDVSTYALIPQAQAGLIWMSTIGVDMVVRNRPVVAAARPKYHGLDIVTEPDNTEAYWTAIRELANQPKGTSPEQKEMAKKYLTILAKEFSYEACSPRYRACDIRLAGHPSGGEFETFYKILAGDLPTETRPHSRDGG